MSLSLYTEPAEEYVRVGGIVSIPADSSIGGTSQLTDVRARSDLIPEFTRGKGVCDGIQDDSFPLTAADSERITKELLGTKIDEQSCCLVIPSGRFASADSTIKQQFWVFENHDTQPPEPPGYKDPKSYHGSVTAYICRKQDAEAEETWNITNYPQVQMTLPPRVKSPRPWPIESLPCYWWKHPEITDTSKDQHPILLKEEAKTLFSNEDPLSCRSFSVGKGPFPSMPGVQWRILNTEREQVEGSDTPHMRYAVTCWIPKEPSTTGQGNAGGQ